MDPYTDLAPISSHRVDKGKSLPPLGGGWDPQTEEGAVPSFGAVRTLYRRINERTSAGGFTPEHVTSAFWGQLMRRYFPDTDTYITSPETPPGQASNRRVDWALRRNVQYDDTSEDILSVAYWELKRPGQAAKKVESQITDAGLRCLNEEGLDNIYLLTACGSLFRTFRMYRFWNGYQTLNMLQPMDDGPESLADISCYYEIDSGIGSAIFQNFVDHCLSHPPTTDRLAESYPNVGNEGSGDSNKGPGDSNEGQEAGPAGMEWQETEPANVDAQPAPAERETETAPTEQPMWRGKPVRHVDMTREKHHGKVAYRYKNVRDHKKYPQREKWKKSKENGQWYLEDDGVFYVAQNPDVF